MICKNCGFQVPENDRFCSNCGAEVRTETPVNESAENVNGDFAKNNTAYGYYSSNQDGYYGNQQNNGGYYAGNPAGNPQGYWAPPVNDKAPGVKDYLKWMLLYPLWNLIPGVGFIVYLVLCFKFALDTANKAKSNYFKAMLIAQVISIAVGVLMVVVMFAFLSIVEGSFLGALEELDPDFFMDEFYYEAHDFLSIVFMK